MPSKKSLLEQLLSDDVTTSYESEDAVLLPLLDEINIIEDEQIKDFVRSILCKANAQFWCMHSHDTPLENPPDEYSEGGNVLHIKRAVRVAFQLCVSHNLDEYDADVVIAAVLLHDIVKSYEIDGEIRFDPFYAYSADRAIEWIREYDSQNTVDGRSSTVWLDEETKDLILRLIRCHQGVWSPIPETVPENELEWIVHYAEIISSKLHYFTDGEKINESRWK